MLNVVLHALSASDHTDSPFVAIMVLLVWDDSPWTSNAIRGHPNMFTLIRIPNGHMRFVPANKQTNDAFNERIHAILAPAIQTVCQLKPEETFFSPPTLHPRPTTVFRALACPTRSLPHMSAINARLPHPGPSTPPQGTRQDILSRQEHTCPDTDPPGTSYAPQGGYTSTQLFIQASQFPSLIRGIRYSPS